MNKLYKKDEIRFSVVWIVIYVVGYSIAEALSSKVGITSIFTAVFNLALSAVLFLWISKTDFSKNTDFAK